MPLVLDVIGAPSSAGAYAPGQEKAPAAFRRHGLIEVLSEGGRRVADRGDVPGFRWRPDPARPSAMNAREVQRVAKAVAERVAVAMDKDARAIVLGGDCTVELGSVAGASRGGSVGLVYIDLDCDLNPPEESDGALDWTGVAHMLGLHGADKGLSGLGESHPLLAPDQVLYFAVDNITPGEAETMARLEVGRITLAEVKANPRACAVRAADWARRFDRLAVHVDADVLDFTSFPVAENTDRRGGLAIEDLAAALDVLLKAPNWRVLTLAEFNPDHAPDETETFRRLNAMLADALPA
jgi:arginase